MIDINKEAEEYGFKTNDGLQSVLLEDAFIAGHNSKATQAKVLQAQINLIQDLYSHFGADSYMAYLGEKFQQQLKELENE